jgi:hypothetical protein
LSGGARALIGRCLDPVAARRPAAEELLADPWFTKPITSDRARRRERLVLAEPYGEFDDGMTPPGGW